MNTSSPERRGLGWLPAVVLPVVVIVVTFAVLRSIGTDSLPFIGRGDPQASNPFAERAPFVDATAPVAEAARTSGSADDKSILEKLAKIPAATWLTPEKLGVDSVGAFVERTSAAAASANQEPVFVIYGITGRDCGSQSSGGLPADQYPLWVDAIADALDGDDAVAILEPDALGMLGQCSDAVERTALLRGAVERLVAADIVTYIDAGHSNWLDAATMADRLRAVGVALARGFATNVANYYGNDQERAYAQQLSALLDGSHFVIDSGRNGAGSNGEWCNPSGRALGTKPGYVDDGSAQDAYLWIKPPGESDGQCHGGPPAGQWWSAGAVSLARTAGW